ncbi:extracellular calcium-sensing receptor [Microcaecilia unicolor]|uniref:Extracellular calcium-sensing receptor-like n=1 Tax=Microcaecilia unicolor TaxID=1415580 RepID=A0A6P7WGT1_9AMPH|nr:extracellular calcium-sensing receptor-like [Microcaecilia unicolor]
MTGQIQLQQLENNAVPDGLLWFQVRSYREVLAVAFAVHEINENPGILPNITLGFKILDSCLSTRLAMANTLSLLSGIEDPVPSYHCSSEPIVPGVVGESFSDITIPIAWLLGVYKIPQISYGSSNVILSNKYLFPSFFRTVPPDSAEAGAIPRLLKHFGWTWVGIIASDNDYGVQGSQRLQTEIERSGGCVEFLERVPIYQTKERVTQIVEMIKRSTAHIIVIYCHVGFIVPVFEEVAKRNIHGKVWLGTTSFIITPDLFTKDTWLSLNGTLALALHVVEIPGFKEFVHSIHPLTSTDDIFIKSFWEKAFECKWIENNTNQNNTEGGSDKLFCTGQEKVDQLDFALFELDNLRYTYNAYQAVYAFAYALHNLVSCRGDAGLSSIRTCVSTNEIQPQQVLEHVRNVHFLTGSDEYFFDENGDPPAIYDILNWQIFPNGSYTCTTVGKFDYTAPQGQEVTVNRSIIVWNSIYSTVPESACSTSCTPGFRRTFKEGQPICCFDCIPCPDGEITNQTDTICCQKCPDDQWPNEKRDTCIPRTIEFLSYEEPLGFVLSAISAFCSLVTVSILGIFLKYKDTPIVKANNRELSYLLLLSLVLCFLCSLLFIGYPMKVKCMLRQTAFGVIFSLCVSCILAKTITVVVAFHATKPSSKLKKWVGTKTSYYLVPLCSVIQLIICLVWLCTAPPFSSINTESAKTIIIQCSEGSVKLFYGMMGYLGFLACVSFIVAFLARNLPDSFNETKYITFSLLVFVSVWISFIPAYLSTQGKYMLAVEVFAILASSTGLLSCIFFPKVYIILLKPERNTKDVLLGKRGIKQTKMIMEEKTFLLTPEISRNSHQNKSCQCYVLRYVDQNVISSYLLYLTTKSTFREK